MMNIPSTTLVTCSYAPDADRCLRLCASVEHFVDPSVPHVLIVPARDRKLFETMTNNRTRVVTAQSLLPKWTWQLPFQHRWWMTPHSLPVRGWIMQQVTKLSASNVVDTDSVTFVDSDVIFIRPFSSQSIAKDGRVRLFRVKGGGDLPSHHRWYRQAGKLLGIKPLDYYGSDYIGQLVSWRRDTVRQLQRQIEKTHGRPWQHVLFNTLHFSEYILYGVFVEKVLADSDNHYFDQKDLCHCSWNYTQNGHCDLDHFFSKIRPHHIAVLVQSNLAINPAEYERKIEALWKDQDRLTKPLSHP